MSKFRCKVCGYIHEGATPPETCPVCGAPASEFELIESDDPEQKPRRKFLGGRNSNAYIVFYTVVMVVLVAALLAVTSLSLKSRQNANVMNEKKNAITMALGLPNGSYDKAIEAYVVNAEGTRIDSSTSPLDMLFDLKATFAEGAYPVFEDKQDGRVVVPVTGTGLWGDIWGYVALDADMNTISGVIFDHASETPGLGAEIATPKFSAQFPGQTIYEGDELVAISVVKGGANGAAHSVDAVTGGTKTSHGLENMLRDCLKYYDALFRSKRDATVVEQITIENASEDGE